MPSLLCSLTGAYDWKGYVGGVLGAFTWFGGCLVWWVTGWSGCFDLGLLVLLRALVSYLFDALRTLWVSVSGALILARWVGEPTGLGLFVAVAVSSCFGVVLPGLGIGGCDEPESLILAQSERWRHA